MTDYVEGAMQDVKRDFCRTVAATGGGKGKKGMGKVDNPEAFYEETVAPVRREGREGGSGGVRRREGEIKCMLTPSLTHFFVFVYLNLTSFLSSLPPSLPPSLSSLPNQCAHSLIDRLTKRLDRRADAFEMYLARNIFKIPKTEPVGKEVGREGGWEGIRLWKEKSVCFCGFSFAYIFIPNIIPPSLPPSLPLSSSSPNRTPWMWTGPNNKSRPRKRKRRKTSPLPAPPSSPPPKPKTRWTRPSPNCESRSARYVLPLPPSLPPFR